jgi:DNA (cytosine-5)-methyltransferase 1
MKILAQIGDNLISFDLGCSQRAFDMPDLLIRDVPPELCDWIRAERENSGRTQNEVALDLLRNGRASTSQLLLFRAKHQAQVLGESLPFTFVDVFAGIGGIRLGLEKVGGRCVWSCEWDRWAQKTYHAWFAEMPHGDVREIDPADIPDHDILAAGFPCQPFSIAGVSKKKSLGRTHGFEDKTQGTLFFHLAKIIKAKRPPILFLENVKNLQSHDGGRTWDVIRTTLEELGYHVFSKIIDAAGWVPQHRERIFIICFDRARFGDQTDFRFPPTPPTTRVLREILEPHVESRYTLSDHLWNYLQDYAAKHKQKGNGFGFGLVNLEGITRTLSARYYKDGSEILIPQRGKNPRRLTPTECARLMGFPDDLPQVVSDTQAYRQFGNAVCPPVSHAVAASIIPTMSRLLATQPLLAASPR